MSKQKKTRRNEITDVDYGVIDETINHILSEGSKLGQKVCKTRHD